MRSLFIDTSASKRIVSILNNSKLNEIIEDNGKDLSLRISNMVDECFKLANILPNEIDNIYVVNGPGSFTGIRTGLTVAKTFAWSMKKKIFLVSELLAMISGIQDNNKLLVPLIDARRDFVYSGIYNTNHHNILQDSYILITDLLAKIPNDSEIIIVSDNNELIKKYEEILSRKNITFSYHEPSYNFSKITEICVKDVNYHAANPKYLKATEAEEKFGIKHD